MKRNKEKHQLQAQFQLYINSVLLNFDHPETILTLKKAAGLISTQKRSPFKKD